MRILSSVVPRHFLSAVGTVVVFALPLGAQTRLTTPEDLFRVERVGSVAWSPDGARAAVEIRRPGRTIDPGIPTNELRLLSLPDGGFTPIRFPDARHIGYFGASWSPTGERLAFFSADSGGSVRLWVMRRGGRRAREVVGISIRHRLGDPARVHWIDDRRLLTVAVDDGAADAGPLYFRVTRSRNASELAARARRGDATAVVMESGGHDSAGPDSRLVRLDLEAGERQTLVRGTIHHLHVSPDRKSIAYFSDAAAVTALPVRTLFDATLPGWMLYDAVNYGTVLHVADASTGAPLVPPTDLINTSYESIRWRQDGSLAIHSGIRGTTPAPRLLSTRGGRLTTHVPSREDTVTERRGQPATSIVPPTDAARRLSLSPTGRAALFLEQDPTVGTRLWLARVDSDPRVLWHGNAWVREIRTGRAEHIRYSGRGGSPLHGWLLYPPDHVPGTRIPIIVEVYPGRVFGATVPPALSPFSDYFENPQLLAALGYGVVLPSAVEPEVPAPEDQRAGVRDGLLPLLDTLIARGIADSSRIGLLGQSAGGYATLSLIAESDRFRTAIASASYSNLASFYGTFYGQYRYGDSGHPQTGQLLRMLQLERGHAALGASPLAMPDAYRVNSPLMRADSIDTPLMLIHGDHDFVPVQQAEELFTALYRQDKRVRFARYYGEFHTIASRQNVLDMWTRIADWLAETMPVEGGA